MQITHFYRFGDYARSACFLLRCNAILQCPEVSTFLGPIFASICIVALLVWVYYKFCSTWSSSAQSSAAATAASARFESDRQRCVFMIGVTFGSVQFDQHGSKVSLVWHRDDVDAALQHSADTAWPSQARMRPRFVRSQTTHSSHLGHSPIVCSQRRPRRRLRQRCLTHSPLSCRSSHGLPRAGSSIGKASSRHSGCTSRCRSFGADSVRSLGLRRH